MFVQSISFGRKSLVTTCKVKNLKTGKFVPVKMYEYDCVDCADIEEVKNLPSNFTYKSAIVTGMEAKKQAKERYCMDTGVSYYIMQTEDGCPLGIASVRNNDEVYGVKYIQTSQDKTHKYVGQTMLASMAKMALNKNREKFEICFPADDAVGFYVHKCGFKHGDSFYHLEMTQKEMKKFVLKTQIKTHSFIVDVRN